MRDIKEREAVMVQGFFSRDSDAVIADRVEKLLMPHWE